MDGITGSISVKFNLVLTKNQDVGDSLTYPLNFTTTYPIAFGAGANQVNKAFADERSLADGANEELDLAGTLADPFNDTLTFASVKFLYIENLSTTQTLTVGGATNGWESLVGATGDLIPIPPGSGHLFISKGATGGVVTAGTVDRLKLLNSAGAACSYRVVILGD